MKNIDKFKQMNVEEATDFYFENFVVAFNDYTPDMKFQLKSRFKRWLESEVEE